MVELDPKDHDFVHVWNEIPSPEPVNNIQKLVHKGADEWHIYEIDNHEAEMNKLNVHASVQERMEEVRVNAKKSRLHFQISVRNSLSEMIAKFKNQVQMDWKAQLKTSKEDMAAQAEAALHIFSRHDASDDKSLEESEFVMLAKELHLCNDDARGHELFDRLVKEYDSDRNRTISWEEFNKWFQNEGYSQLMLVRMASAQFDVLDANCNGTLDKEEFKKLLSQFDTKNEVDAQAVFHQIDKDAGNEISKDEFLDWFLYSGKPELRTILPKKYDAKFLEGEWIHQKVHDVKVTIVGQTLKVEHSQDKAQTYDMNTVWQEDRFVLGELTGAPGHTVVPSLAMVHHFVLWSDDTKWKRRDTGGGGDDDMIQVGPVADMDETDRQDQFALNLDGPQAKYAAGEGGKEVASPVTASCAPGLDLGGIARPISRMLALRNSSRVSPTQGAPARSQALTTDKFAIEADLDVNKELQDIKEEEEAATSRDENEAQELEDIEREIETLGLY